MSQDFVKGIQTDIDGTLAANADTRAATQKATKTYSDAAAAGITDATLPTSDITTNNVSNTKHGFAPKHPNDSTKFLDGTAAYSVPLTYHWYRWIESSLMNIRAVGAASDAEGCTRAESGTATNSDPTANQLGCLNLATSNVSGNVAYSGSDITATGNWVVGREGRYMAHFRLVDTTNIQVWIGMTALANASQVASDAPTGNYAMFRFSTVAGDTNWKFVIGDGAATEVFDTGVSIASTATNMARFEIRWDGTATNSFTAYINGTLVATGTKNPAAGTLIHFIVLNTTQAAAIKSVKIAGQFLRTRMP